MRITASALTVLFAFFALTSSVLAQGDTVVGREVDSDSNGYHKHKPHPPRPPPCNPCGRPPVCAKGRKCVDRRRCPAQGDTDIVCPLDNARRGEDGYGDGGNGKDGGHDGKGGNKGVLPGDDKGPGGHHGGKPPGPGKGDGGDYGGKPSKPGDDKGPGGHHGGKPPGPGKGDGGDYGGKPSKPGNGHGGGPGGNKGNGGYDL